MIPLNLKRPSEAGFLLLLLLPGVGLIVILVGAVILMAVAQSLGYFNFSGESAFSFDHWQRPAVRGLRLRGSLQG